MPANNDRSVVTLRAKPWVVTQRDRWTPIEAIFAAPHPDADVLLAVAHPAFDAVAGQRPDQRLLEVAHVAADVAAVGAEVEDRIADQLAGAVVGHLAAAVALGDLDPPRRQRRRRGDHVAGRGVPPQGVDVGMLEQEQVLRPRPPLDAVAGGELHRQGLGVGDLAEKAGAEGAARRSRHRVIVDRRRQSQRSRNPLQRADLGQLEPARPPSHLAAVATWTGGMVASSAS